jgi:hypothetical protein
MPTATASSIAVSFGLRTETKTGFTIRSQTMTKDIRTDAMAKPGSPLAVLTSALILAMSTAPPARTEPMQLVWFAPDGETPDFLDLFNAPSLWESSRARINVFKFSPMQVSTSSVPKVNTYSDLVKADAFRKLKDWKLSIAIEAPAIKEWDCSGNHPVRVTLEYIRNVRSAGGAVRFIAMDEPLVSGFRSCHLTFDEIAARTATYVKTTLNDPSLSTADRNMKFGDIEPYPFFSIDQLQQWINALQHSGFKPDFFHLDVDVNDVELHPQLDLAADLRLLKVFLQSKDIPFGVIFWSGRNPESSDQAYYDHVIDYVRRVHDAIGVSEQLIFQSWVLRASSSCSLTLPCSIERPRCTSSDPSYCGSHSIPINLPDNSREIFSHTRLINDSLAILASP